MTRKQLEILIKFTSFFLFMPKRKTWDWFLASYPEINEKELKEALQVASGLFNELLPKILNNKKDV